MKNKIYLLQGIIFQRGEILGIGQDPVIGSRATIQDAMLYAVFTGIIGPEKETPEIFAGSMVDRWGPSIITNFKISENELSFEKTYKNRPTITYQFSKKEGPLWLGSWNGPDCGKGTSKCIINETDESFFEFQDLEKPAT